MENSIRKDKIRIYFNFYAYKSLDNVRKIYDIINSKGRKKSEFVANAYVVYKKQKDIPQKTLALINNINLLKYITNKYNIQKNDSNKIKTILETVDFSSQPPLKEMNSGRITLGYEKDDEIGLEVCELFNKMDNIDKVFKLVEIVSRYLETGYDEDYLERESEELLKNLAALYSYSKNDKTLDEIVRTISIPFDADYLPSYVRITNDFEKSRDAVMQAFSDYENK